MTITEILVARLRREEVVKELRREPVSETHEKVYEEVRTTLGWLNIFAIPHLVAPLLAVGTLAFGGPEFAPEWYIDIFVPWMYAWLAGMFVLFMIGDRKTRSRLEWRRDTYPPAHIGV